MNNTTRWWRRPEALLVVIAFAMRMAFMLGGHTYRFSPVKNHFGFGFETGSIAGAIARGEGFSSPFAEPTGPTAWIGPIYPYMLAGIFKIFGLYSDASAIAILTINSVFAALTCWTIFQIADRLFGRRAAIASATIWAVVPFFYRYAITWVWDPPVSAFLLSLGVLLVLRIEDGRWRDWLRLGLLAGISALVNPALSTLFPILFVWASWRVWGGRVRLWVPAVGALVVMGVCISPWLIRNRLVFGQWVFLRSNAPFEFNLGNFPGTAGAPFAGRHPVNNPKIMNQYRQMGEIAFVRMKGAEATAWAKANPSDFVKVSLKRVKDFWDGGELEYEPLDDPWKPWMVSLESGLALAGLAVAAARRVRNIGPVVLMLLVYPLPYYIVYTNPRYRHAIEPLLAVFIGYLLATMWEALRKTEDAKPAQSVTANQA